jgi:hypothetical protein
MAGKGKIKGSRKTGGRKPGSPNKLTVAAREAYQLAFEGIGGVPAFTEWAKLHSKTIPLDVTTNGKELTTLTWTFGERKVTF